MITVDEAYYNFITTLEGHLDRYLQSRSPEDRKVVMNDPFYLETRVKLDPNIPMHIDQIIDLYSALVARATILVFIEACKKG
jgi:hypothetical protein